MIVFHKKEKTRKSVSQLALFAGKRCTFQCVKGTFSRYHGVSCILKAHDFHHLFPLSLASLIFISSPLLSSSLFSSVVSLLSLFLSFSLCFVLSLILLLCCCRWLLLCCGCVFVVLRLFLASEQNVHAISPYFLCQSSHC